MESPFLSAVLVNCLNNIVGSHFILLQDPRPILNLHSTCLAILFVIADFKVISYMIRVAIYFIFALLCLPKN